MDNNHPYAAYNIANIKQNALGLHFHLSVDLIVFISVLAIDSSLGRPFAKTHVEIGRIEAFCSFTESHMKICGVESFCTLSKAHMKIGRVELSFTKAHVEIGGIESFASFPKAHVKIGRIVVSLAETHVKISRVEIPFSKAHMEVGRIVASLGSRVQIQEYCRLLRLSRSTGRISLNEPQGLSENRREA